VSVTAITASLPERGRLFADLAESMARQSLPPARWLVEWDYAKRGPVEVLNKLASHVETDWLFRVDDDDVLERDHFDTCRPYLQDADVVYSWCRVEGGGYPTMYQREFSANNVQRENNIPSCAFIRTELWNHLGGLREPEWTRHEDWDFWLRALKAGARFRCVPIVTWRYRIDESWDHRSILT
jgi:hypothetical protein